MDNFQIIFGCIHVISAVLCVPVLFRLFYILVSRKEYRNSTCYRLIAQEILLCCMSGCSYFVYGLAMILDSELAGILLCAHAITRNSFISIACLNLALALKIPHFVVQCLQAVAWSFIVIAVSIELAGATGIKLLDNGAIVYEDVSLLVTLIFYRTMAVLLFTSLPLSFFIYLAITAFLIHRRKQRHLNETTATSPSSATQKCGATYSELHYTFLTTSYQLATKFYHHHLSGRMYD
ncbi:hypothetical protein QR680_010056 [Steinernema hermaphroditum]|uniref:Uncharacterized protein n=1 Tax=Steinernema hermaphroditum TaxID=289476 RepID=A0AA39IMJ8_9BILA|nr:hypothetical protein QR680_010056 [Steinernema hermaphroditum]